MFFETDKNKKIRVGIVSTNNAPYVIREGDSYSGISVDIWKNVAKNADIDYEFIEAGRTNAESIKKLNNKEVDVLVGPYSITNKTYQHVNYTIPYYLADIGLASLYKVNNLENYINISKVLAYVIFLFIFVLFLNNFIHNFKKDMDFAQYFIHSVPDFKDRKMWILYLIIFLSIFILYINFFNPNFNLGNTSLKGKTILYTDSTHSHKKVIKNNKFKGIKVEIKNTADHLKQIQQDNILNEYIKKQNEAFGAIEDTSKIAYILNHNIDKFENINIIRSNLTYDTYAFIVPKKSKHLENINVALKESQNQKINQIIVKKYLGNKFENHVSF